MLDSRMLEALCSSFLVLTAVITKTFKITAMGEAIDTMASKTQGKMVSVKSHVKVGLCVQIKH